MFTDGARLYAPPLPPVLYEIYRPDHKPLTLVLPVNTPVQDVISAVARPGGDHVLVRMNSAGGQDACVNDPPPSAR